MGNVVLSFLLLVLEVSSKLASNTINKGLGVPKIFLKKFFKLWPRNQSGTFVAALVLGSSEDVGAAEEGSGK